MQALSACRKVHDIAASARLEEMRPRLHERPPFFERVAPPVGPRRGVADDGQARPRRPRAGNGFRFPPSRERPNGSHERSRCRGSFAGEAFPSPRPKANGRRRNRERPNPCAHLPWPRRVRPALARKADAVFARGLKCVGQLCPWLSIDSSISHLPKALLPISSTRSIRDLPMDRRVLLGCSLSSRSCPLF